MRDFDQGFQVAPKCRAPGPLFPVRQDAIDASLLNRLLNRDQSCRLRGKERCVSIRACKVEHTEGRVNPVMAGDGGIAKMRTDGGHDAGCDRDVGKPRRLFAKYITV